jgi:hypothetical protein
MYGIRSRVSAANPIAKATALDDDVADFPNPRLFFMIYLDSVGECLDKLPSTLPSTKVWRWSWRLESLTRRTRQTQKTQDEVCTQHYLYNNFFKEVTLSVLCKTDKNYCGVIFYLKTFKNSNHGAYFYF